MNIPLRNKRIRSLAKLLPNRVLARRFGVTSNTISKICHGLRKRGRPKGRLNTPEIPEKLRRGWGRGLEEVPAKVVRNMQILRKKAKWTTGRLAKYFGMTRQRIHQLVGNGKAPAMDALKSTDTNVSVGDEGVALVRVPVNCLWNMQDLAKYLRVTVQTLYSWGREKLPPYILIAGSTRFNPETVRKWVRAKTVGRIQMTRVPAWLEHELKKPMQTRAKLS
jgi:DNA-binding XRE family transcriptional regulator